MSLRVNGLYVDGLRVDGLCADDLKVKISKNIIKHLNLSPSTYLIYSNGFYLCGTTKFLLCHLKFTIF